MIAYDDFTPADVIFHTGLYSHKAAEILDIIFNNSYNIKLDYQVGQDINGEVDVVYIPAYPRGMTQWFDCKQRSSTPAKEAICTVLDNIVESKLQCYNSKYYKVVAFNIMSNATLMSSNTRRLDTMFDIPAADIKALREFFVNGITPPPHLAGMPFNLVEVEAIDMISQKIARIIDLRKNCIKSFQDVINEVRRKYAAYDAFNTHEKLGLDRMHDLELNMSNDLVEMVDLVEMRDEIILKHEDLVR